MDEPAVQTPENPPSDAARLLVEYLRHRDVQCPRCDYSLRNAVSANCPECGEPLRLAVGLERPIMGALLAAVAPGLGCGVCAVIFSAMMLAHPGAPPQIVLATILMFISGMLALGIVVMRRRFLRQPRERQRAIAIASIAINIMLVVLLGASFN